MIYIVLLYLLFLWMFSGVHKGWLLFAAALSVITQFRAINIVTLGVLTGLAKFGIDLWDAGKKWQG